jgi:integrase
VRVPPKTATSRRDVPVPEWVADVLSAHLAAHPTGPEEFLFTNGHGRPYGHADYSRRFKTAVAAAGLPEAFSSHSLRHGYATALLADGISPVAVGRLLGHQDGTLVLRLYGHKMPADDDLARVAMDRTWTGAGESSTGLRVAR